MNVMRALLIASIMLTGTGCGQRLSPSTPPGEENNVTPIADDDAQVNRAIAKAQSTAPDFLTALAHPSTDQGDFAVIKRCLGDGSKEDLWLSDVTYDGQLIHGKIDNIPEYVTSLHEGDEQTVAPADVIDWKYLDHGKLVGGYTIRAYYAESSPQQKAQILEGGHFTAADMVPNY